MCFLCESVSGVPGIPLFYDRIPYHYGGDVQFLMVGFHPPLSGILRNLKLQVPTPVVRPMTKRMQWRRGRDHTFVCVINFRLDPNIKRWLIPGLIRDKHSLGTTLSRMSYNAWHTKWGMILYSTAYHPVFLWLFLLFLSCFDHFCLSVYVVFSLLCFCHFCIVLVFFVLYCIVLLCLYILPHNTRYFMRTREAHVLYPDFMDA